MTATILTAFLASLLGSLHCAAMCGGLVSFTCGTGRRPVLDQVAYHTARVVAYASLGAIAGYAGHTLNRTALVLGWQNAAAWVAGGAMIAWALVTLWPLSRRKKPSSGVQLTSKGKNSKLSVWFAWLYRMPSGVRGALLGFTTALLPCGWLYTFVATASGQGNAWAGAGLMVAFALGSVPILVGVGGLVRVANEKVRRWVPQLSAVVLLVLGLTTVLVRAPYSFATPSNNAPSSPPHACH